MSSSPVFIGANWKMSLDLSEAEDLAKKISGFNDKLMNDVVIFPSFVHIHLVSKILRDTKFKLGAQNVAFCNEKAMTGEISTRMLKDLGCDWVIVGHSERRHKINESSDILLKKLERALEDDFSVIFCIGEGMVDRKKNNADKVIISQLDEVFSKSPAWPWERVVIAYEPVWAIGTGLVPTTEDINSIHSLVRRWLSSRYDSSSDNLDDLRLIYGGSVNSENVHSLASSKWIEGALVGGAALKAESFQNIVEASWSK